MDQSTIKFVNKALEDRLAVVLPSFKDEIIQSLSDMLVNAFSESFLEQFMTSDFKEKINENIANQIDTNLKEYLSTLAKSESTKAAVKPKAASKTKKPQKTIEEIFGQYKEDELINLYTKKQNKYSPSADKNIRECGFNLATKKDFVLKEDSIVNMMTFEAYGEEKKWLFSLGYPLVLNDQTVQDFVVKHNLTINEVTTFPYYYQKNPMYSYKPEFIQAQMYNKEIIDDQDIP